MPGNTVKINESKNLEWYVGDSKMKKLIKCLGKIGFREDEKQEKKPTSDAVKIMHRRYHKALCQKLLFRWHKILFRIEDWWDLRATKN